MFRLTFVLIVSLCLLGQSFGAEKVLANGDNSETRNVDGNGTGVFVLNKKGDTVKIVESLYEELNIFCHTGILPVLNP